MKTIKHGFLSMWNKERESIASFFSILTILLLEESENRLKPFQT